MRTINLLESWTKILRGQTPMLSIEITRECPLRCPGCYAYGSDHLGGGITLRELTDKRGNELVEGVIGLVDRHKPMHVTLVGGEPMIRHRELSLILLQLAHRGIFSMVVTSGVIPVPLEWMALPNFTVAVSIDGLPEHHDVRRNPATYQRILENIVGRRVNVHWTITAQMLARPRYLEEYVRFWNLRPEVCVIWVSLYSPQRGERSAEQLSADQRKLVANELPRLHARYPKLLTPEGYANAVLRPPASPAACTFSRLSKTYSADLETHVEPCVFGRSPDCSQCGCSASAAAHWIPIVGSLRIKHLIRASMAIGSAAARFHHSAPPAWRQRDQLSRKGTQGLVQISPGD